MPELAADEDDVESVRDEEAREGVPAVVEDWLAVRPRQLDAPKRFIEASGLDAGPVERRARGADEDEVASCEYRAASRFSYSARARRTVGESRISRPLRSQSSARLDAT
jgi:hypothetical protein